MLEYRYFRSTTFYLLADPDPQSYVLWWNIQAKHNKLSRDISLRYNRLVNQVSIRRLVPEEEIRN